MAEILITASEDYGKVEIPVPFNDPVETLNILRSPTFTEVVEEAIQQQVLLSKSLKAVHGLAPAEPTQVQENVVTPAPSRWGSSGGQQSVPPQGGNNPLNLTCPVCGQAATHSKTKSGSDWWKCPNYQGVKGPDGKYVKGGNGHLSTFGD